MKLLRNTFLFTATLVATGVGPFVVAAQGGFVPLSAIPGVQGTGGSLADYVNALFLLSITVGALLAVVKIAIGGVQYMMSDVVTKKEDAKETITGALLGLGILLATYIVLAAINPQLVSLSILGGANPVNLQPLPSGSGGTGGSIGGGQNTDPLPPQPGERVVDCTDGVSVSSAKIQCESSVLFGSCGLFGEAGRFYPGESTVNQTVNAKCIFPEIPGTPPPPETGESSETISCVGNEFGTYDCSGAISTCLAHDPVARYEEGNGFIECYYPDPDSSGGPENTQSGTIQTISYNCAGNDPNKTVLENCEEAVSTCQATPGYVSHTFFSNPERVQCEYRA